MSTAWKDPYGWLVIGILVVTLSGLPLAFWYDDPTWLVTLLGFIVLIAA